MFCKTLNWSSLLIGFLVIYFFVLWLATGIFGVDDGYLTVERKDRKGVL